MLSEKETKSGRARIISLIIIGLVGLCASSPAVAMAGSDRFMQYQGLSAGNAKASVPTAVGNLYVIGESDHTFCPAVARGYAGYTSSPNSGGNLTAAGANCGPGVRNGWWTSGIHYHGAVLNPNASTFDNFTYADFIW